jgi:hypothetical protein
MVRSDVPILVSPKSDSIDVHATPAQHVAFEAFVDMINAEDQVQSYELPDGRLQALTELMVRSDVPVLVSPGDDSIKVHGTTLQQTIFGHFVNMIAPSGAHVGVGQMWGAEARAKATAKERKRIKEKTQKKVRHKKKSHKRTTIQYGDEDDSYHAAVLDQAAAVLGHERAETLARRLAALAESEGVQNAVEHAARYALEARLQDFQNQEHGLQLKAKQLQHQSQLLREQAARQIEKARQFEQKMQELQERAQQLDDRADAILDNAETLPAEERAAVLAEAETARAEGAAIEASAESLETEAEGVEAEADRLSEEADSYAEAAETLLETAAALAERAYVSAQTP